jgi:transcriptional/translational regulatory protein YebC/TACO1
LGTNRPLWKRRKDGSVLGHEPLAESLRERRALAVDPAAGQVLELIDKLEQDEDVQEVYHTLA